MGDTAYDDDTRADLLGLVSDEAERLDRTVAMARAKRLLPGKARSSSTGRRFASCCRASHARTPRKRSIPYGNWPTMRGEMGSPDGLGTG